MDTRRFFVWPNLAFVVGVALVAIHGGIRLSSGFGWVVLIDMVYVVS